MEMNEVVMRDIKEKDLLDVKKWKEKLKFEIKMKIVNKKKFVIE
jgi:hypothetical protein